MGLYTLAREIIDNSSDELELLGIGSIDVIMFHDHRRHTYQLAVIDSGRGIPRDKLIDAYSSSRVSGKFDTKSYRFSSGTFGVGSTVVCALSEWFRAITLNKDMIGDATIPYDNIPTHIDVVTNHLNRTGTIVLFSPDRVIFTGIQEFIEDYSKLTEYLINLSLFSKYQIRFIKVDNGIPKSIRTASSLQVIEYLDNICNTIQPEYNSASLDRNNYIQSYFGIQRWNAKYNLLGQNVDDTLRIEGDILVSLSNTSGISNNRLTFVNNLLFTDNSSVHISLLTKFIKGKMQNKIQDKNIKAFFIDQYKLPIWLVLNVKFSGAQFSGFAKVSFRDVAFKAPYTTLLNELITNEIIEDMYELMTEHINMCYNRFTNNDFKPSTMRKLLSNLSRPKKFNNCSTTDRQTAELFLMEGDSAKSDQDRSSVFQATYTLGGKPFNGLTDTRHINETISNIKKNDIFRDIIKILNITPGSNDLSNLNFHKLFIMADADTHGYHITNIMLGNLYILCPALIEQRKIYVTIPPLYSLDIKGNESIYIRNHTELVATLAYHVYYRCLDIKVKSDRYYKSLSREELVAFSELVIKIGDELDRLSDEYMIPSALLEQLSLATNFLDMKKPKVDALREMLGCDIKYIPTGNLLIVSIGSDDIVVPLNQITELIYARILPMYREFYYGKTKIFATTKNSALMSDSPVTLVQLHEIFKKLDSMFTIKRYKGLGSMPPGALAKNCFDPKTRRAYQIGSIGDIKTIFDMLGSDPTERKKLVLS